MSAIEVGLPAPGLQGEDGERRWRLLRRFLAPVVMGLAPSYAYGVDRIPASGGFVLAANHFSGIDHPLLEAFCPRPICFLAKAELFAQPLLGGLLAWTGAFPVRRGQADRAALRHARELAVAGHAVAVHVEGTRQRSGCPGEFKAGAIAIAMRARVAIVPCGLDTFGWSPLNRRPCAVVFGAPS